MSSLVYLRSKNGETVYVYVNEKDGDGVYRRRCIGHLDPVTGEIVPNREKKSASGASVRSYGVNMLLRRISDDIGLTESLQIVFKDSWDSILSFAFYCLAEDSHITEMTRWMEFNETPRMWPLSSDEIRSILKDITQDDIESFFRVWNKRSGDADYVMTSLSTDRWIEKKSKLDLEKEFSTELQICYGRETGNPISYHIHPAKFRTLQEMYSSNRKEEWADNERTSYILEEEQVKEIGLDNILKMDRNYVLSLPSDSHLFGNILSDNTTKQSLETLQFRTAVHTFHGKKTYIHMLYDPVVAEMEISRFLNIIEKCRSELRNQQYVTTHAPIYNRYFIIKGRRDIELNSREIMQHNSSAGYRIIMSNDVSDYNTAMKWTERNDYCRRMYDRMHNDADLVSMKLYLESNLASRTFIQFLSTILGIRLDRMISDGRLNETVDSVLFQMKSLIRVDVRSRRRPIMSEINGHQRSILDVLLASE